MLIIKTCVGLSEIRGLGLFADEPIRKGQVIACWMPMFDAQYLEQEVSGLPEPIRSTIMKYGFLSAGKWHLNGDDMRFMNHSDTPNIGCSLTMDFALRDIEDGEELTTDYRWFDEDAVRKLKGD